MFEIICGILAVFFAGWVSLAVTGPIFASRNPVSIAALVAGASLLLFLTR